MENLNNLDLLTLADMLARYTRDYINMQQKGNTGTEYTRCRTMIQNLNAEIAYRKLKFSNDPKKKNN
ncbi:MAG: hypothetical protein IPP73_17450 [Chitinophagaceae bacterium]|nr:hypothetical protein [Chitinophagaceae bacterium]